MTSFGGTELADAIEPTGRRVALWQDRPLVRSATVVTVGSVALWDLALRGMHADQVGVRGFFDVLSPLFLLAVSMLAVGFAMALSAAKPRPWLLALQLVALLFMLYGTVCIVEPLARFDTTWLHAGFTDYIARTGHTAPSYDARFNWPGFFAAAAMFSKAAGLSSPVTLLKWAPVYFNAIFAVGVYALASAATSVERTRWLTVWIFLSANWVGQDYYSPQALGYLLALCCAVILLRWFRSVRLLPAGGARSLATRWVTLVRWAPDETPLQLPSNRESVVLSGLLFVLFGALVVTHQLTPPVVIVWALALVIAQRCRIRALPFAFVSIFLLWLSYGTVAYWSGHLHDLFGSIGHFGASVNQNLTNRVSGASSRVFIQDVRLVFTAAVFALAGVGAVRRLRAGYGDLSFGLLALAPFSVLLVQSYGGEALLRSLFLALPFLALFCAFAFFPRGGAPSVFRYSLLAVVLAGAIPVFFLARYGNEAWDMETPKELAAFQYVYNTAPPGSTLISIASEVPWGYRDVLKFKLEQNSTLANPVQAGLELFYAPGPAAYLIVTQDQANFGWLFSGQPRDWATKMERSLLGVGRYKLVFSNSDAQVIARLPQAVHP